MDCLRVTRDQVRTPEVGLDGRVVSDGRVVCATDIPIARCTTDIPIAGQQIYLANHQEAEDQQRAQEVLPPVVLRVAQLRMVRGRAEDPADLDLPTPGCCAAA